MTGEFNGDHPDYNLVVIGKTGSGKSWVCNRLLGHQGPQGPFPVYDGMGRQTRKAQCEERLQGKRRLHVIDTPDVFNLNDGKASAAQKFKKWESLIVPSGPIAVLFIVRLDVRFTPNDYQLYQQYRKLLPASLRNNVILGFTRVDDLPGPVDEQITLSCVKTLLNDCQGRYVVFYTPSDGHSSQAGQTGDWQLNGEQIVDKIMYWMMEMPAWRLWFYRAQVAVWSGVLRLIRRRRDLTRFQCAFCVTMIGTACLLLYYLHHLSSKNV